MILLYPALLIGTAVLVLQRRGHAGGRGWLWFAAWVVAGALLTFSLVTGLSIGLLVLPLVTITMLGVAWLSPHIREASGLVVGAAAFIGALFVLL